jgi:carboxylesterase type B
MWQHLVALLPFLGFLHLVRGEDVHNTTVEIPGAFIIGNVMNDVESFGGIPFAEPPIGNQRLRPPMRLRSPLGQLDATGPAGACPQMVVSVESQDFLFKLVGKIANLPWIQEATGQSEDCLTVTVARPSGTTADEKLPVLFYIYGGGYQVSTIGVCFPSIFD